MYFSSNDKGHMVSTWKWNLKLWQCWNVSGGPHCTAVGLACSWVMLCRYLSVVMLLCRSCSLLTPYSLLSTAHYSFVHCFTARSIPLIPHLYHCSLFTVQLEWHFYRDTAQDSHFRSVGSCQVVTTAIIQHLYSNEHRTKIMNLHVHVSTQL